MAITEIANKLQQNIEIDTPEIKKLAYTKKDAKLLVLIAGRCRKFRPKTNFTLHFFKQIIQFKYINFFYVSIVSVLFDTRYLNNI